MNQNKFERKCAKAEKFYQKSGHKPSVTSSNPRERKIALWVAKKEIKFDLNEIKAHYECACKIYALVNHAAPASGPKPMTTGEKAAATRRANLAKMTPGERSAATRKKRLAGKKGAATRKANQAKNGI